MVSWVNVEIILPKTKSIHKYIIFESKVDVQ